MGNYFHSKLWTVLIYTAIVKMSKTITASQNLTNPSLQFRAPLTHITNTSVPSTAKGNNTRLASTMTKPATLRYNGSTVTAGTAMTPHTAASSSGAPSVVNSTHLRSASTSVTNTTAPSVTIGAVKSTRPSYATSTSFTNTSTTSIYSRSVSAITPNTPTTDHVLLSLTATFPLTATITNKTKGTNLPFGLQTSQTPPLPSSNLTKTKSQTTSTKGMITISNRTTKSDTIPFGSGLKPRTPPLVKIRFNEDNVLPEAFSRNLVVTFIVIYIFIIVLAFFGNLLVIFVIAWARMVRSFTDLFVLSLAVSDILISTINMPIQLNLIVINEWRMGDFFCKFTHYLQAVTIVANILTLTAIAIDRYLVICHSDVSRKIHTKRFAILGLVVVWLVALSVVSPQLIVQRIEPRIKIDFKTFNILGISQVCIEKFSKTGKYNRKIFSLTIFLGAYLVPVFVMVFTYGAIAHRLWVQQPIGDILANPRNHARSIKQKRKVIKMLMLLVVAFTVLWFPFFTASLYQEFAKTTPSFRITLVILQLVGYSNCCCNPIIYTFLNKKFQMEFKRIFCRRRRRIITSIHIIERRSQSNPQSVHSNPHSIHSSSHNDVIVQGLNKPTACLHV